MKTETRTVTIDGIEIPMRISGATVIYYRNEFRKDMFASLAKLQGGEVETDEDGNAVSMTLPDGAVETLLEVGFIMAKQANPKMKMSIEEWLDQFSWDSITGEALSEIASMIRSDKESLEEPKKNNEEQSGE